MTTSQTRPTRSVLLVHHRQLSTPYGTTIPHYVTKELATSHTVHLLCRRRSDTADDGDLPETVDYTEIDAGQIPILSGILFLLLSTAYTGVFAVRNDYDAIYAFQQTIIQGWIGSLVGGARFVVGLQSVPVRQTRDLSRAGDRRVPLKKRLRVAFKSRYAWAVGRLLAKATAVTCLTDGIRATTEQEYGIDLSDAHIIGMGVDVERFAVDDAAETAADTFVLTYVGSIGVPRGLEHVIEAVAATDHEIQFRVAGTGSDDYIESLQRLARDLDIEDRVTWLGLVPHDAIPALVAQSDAAISPLHDIESYRISFPAKLLEYMAAGTVVIATDIPAHRRLIDDGRNGLLYDGSAATLRDTLDGCLRGDVDSRRLGQAARDTVAAYDWTAIAHEHEHALFGTPLDRPDSSTVADASTHSSETVSAEGDEG